MNRNILVGIMIVLLVSSFSNVSAEEFNRVSAPVSYGPSDNSSNQDNTHATPVANQNNAQGVAGGVNQNNAQDAAGSAPTTKDLNLRIDCRVIGNECKEEPKVEETKKEEVKKDETKTEDKQEKIVVGSPVEKELNGKKYFIMNGSNLLAIRVLVDTKDFVSKFKDIAESTAKDAIAKLEKAGFVHGTTPTTFEPNRAITRAEFLAMAMQAFNTPFIEDYSNVKFTDVKVEWQKKVIASALKFGYVTDTNSTFRPNEQISKIEALAILNKLSGIYLAEDNKFAHSFVDAAADWQNAVLNTAEYLELVKVPADKKFNPNSGISRADMASLIVDFAKLY